MFSVTIPHNKSQNLHCIELYSSKPRYSFFVSNFIVPVLYWEFLSRAGGEGELLLAAAQFVALLLPRKMMFSIVCVLASLALVSGAIESHKVTKLPGFVGDLPSTHYSGCKFIKYNKATTRIHMLNRGHFPSMNFYFIFNNWLFRLDNLCLFTSENS